jgi:pimeloyl-ACP methyl ester carboxylesterase
MFDEFLKIMGKDRSVYAPDRPGCGESDPGSRAGAAAADAAAADAAALSDLAADLRLRKIDLLGVDDGCAVAAELALLKPDLVRRVAFVSSAAVERAARFVQPTQVMKFPADAFENNLAGVVHAAGQFLNHR